MIIGFNLIFIKNLINPILKMTIKKNHNKNKFFRQNKKIVIVCVIIFFLSLALVLINILIRWLINLTNLAENMNNIDNKDPIND